LVYQFAHPPCHPAGARILRSFFFLPSPLPFWMTSYHPFPRGLTRPERLWPPARFFFSSSIESLRLFTISPLSTRLPPVLLPPPIISSSHGFLRDRVPFSPGTPSSPISCWPIRKLVLIPFNSLVHGFFFFWFLFLCVDG